MRNVTMIGLSGPAGCGKDALADHLVAEHGYLKIRFAGYLYRMIYQLPYLEEFRWTDREWKEAIHPFYGVSPRRMLQTLGTEWGRELVNDNLWIKLIEWLIEFQHISHRFFVFPDLRFANESEWLTKYGGLTVAIQRPFSTSIKRTLERSHSSEEYRLLVDEIVVNDKGLQELKNQARRLDALARKASAYSR